jgi:hypothetical protein
VTPKAQALLKALLSKSEAREELLHFLPATLAEEVQNLPSGSAFYPSALLSADKWSLPIHFSWFSDIIKEYPEAIQLLFLHALNEPQAKKIQQLLSLPEMTTGLSPFLRPFLLNILRNNLQEADLLSEQHLPLTPLNSLLDLERKYLLRIVDLLGSHDLAADLRQVVDKELLRKVYNVLDEGQLHFLHYCSMQPIKWVSPKLGLTAWDGSKKQLASLLHYRGLIRLAKAIVKEDLSFKWHLLHRLDTGRAKIIQKEFYRKQDPALIPYFKNQVLHIAKRFQK